MSETLIRTKILCPSTGEKCVSETFCANRKELIDADGYHQDVIGDAVISDLECEIASAVIGEHCAEVIQLRLANLVVRGVGVNTQRQAENLSEIVSYVRHGDYI
jgi:hypothetical protein